MPTFSLIVPNYAVPQMGTEHVHHSAWEQGFGAVFVVIVAWLVSLRKTVESGKTSEVIDIKQTVGVEGMTCQGCVKRLHALDANELTLGTTVSLPPGQVSFQIVQRLHIETVVNSLGFR